MKIILLHCLTKEPSDEHSNEHSDEQQMKELLSSDHSDTHSWSSSVVTKCTKTDRAKRKHSDKHAHRQKDKAGAINIHSVWKDTGKHISFTRKRQQTRN